jgi:hypothetical protein
MGIWDGTDLVLGQAGMFEKKRREYKMLRGMVAGLMLTVGMCPLAFGAPAPAAAPSLSQQFTDIEQTLKKLGAPLELTPDEVVYLNQAAMQLNDSKTGKPYETLSQHLLPYYVLDSELPATAQAPKTVLFIGGIHADEVAPMVTVWHTLLDLSEKKESLGAGIRLVFAPLTNPDGFLTSTRLHGMPTRENLHGVDLNRNFAHGSPEVETRFLMDLINDFHPDAIISLHAPYDWLDYDGPAKIKGTSPDTVKSVQDWLDSIQASALVHIPINANFEIYPGSLGEYAGFQRKIHTLTYEYPTKEASHGESDWKTLGPSLLRALNPPL